MRVYGADTFVISYACECKAGEVRLSHEHSAYRWIDARDYRERYFSQGQIEQLRARDPALAKLSLAVRDEIDEYLAWRARP